MKVKKIAKCGTLESSDILITVMPQEDITIELLSDVEKQYGDSIKKVIMNTVKELGVSDIYIKAQDKGALDYTIKARLETAIQRASED